MAGAVAAADLRSGVGPYDYDRPVRDREIHGIAKIGDASGGSGQALGSAIGQGREVDRQAVTDKIDLHFRSVPACEDMRSGERNRAIVLARIAIG